MKTYYLYILASKKNGTLYTGVTNNLLKRVYEHKQNLVPGFTRKYNVHRLVCYEEFTDIHSAIAREKRMKKWRRQWKVNLIEEANPDWEDLYYRLGGCQDDAATASGENAAPCHSRAGGNPKGPDSATSAE